MVALALKVWSIILMTLSSAFSVSPVPFSPSPASERRCRLVSNFRQDAGVAQQDVETSHAPFHFLAHRAAFLPLRDFPDATVLTFRQLSKGMEPAGRSASDPLSEATDRPRLLWRGHVPIASMTIEALAG
jgi:hypothetical protein